MGMVIKAGAVAAVAGIAMINTSWFRKDDIPKATLSYLSNTELKTLDGSNKALLAAKLWRENGAVIMVVRRPGCLFCREEASKLSSLKNELDQKSVPLIGVVHQTTGVEGFRPFFKGDLYLDAERKFYGPFERWENVLVGLLRLKVWRNVYRAKTAGYSGNFGGEGRLMGGLFVIGSEDQGVLFEYREKEWGDHADLRDVMKAVEKINQDSN